MVSGAADGLVKLWDLRYVVELLHPFRDTSSCSCCPPFLSSRCPLAAVAKGCRRVLVALKLCEWVCVCGQGGQAHERL